jgi:sulfite reductase alpha subunit-like flavoprotein
VNIGPGLPYHIAVIASHPFPLPPSHPPHTHPYKSVQSTTLQIHLCVAVATTRTPYGRRKVGLCSGFLSRTLAGDPVVLWVRRGAFALAKYLPLSPGQLVTPPLPPSQPLPPPQSALSPQSLPPLSPPLSLPSPAPSINTLPCPSPVTLIMVGPGTGVAPMRAILCERTAIHPQAQPNSVLFFGCRSRQGDNLYGDEWSSLCTPDKQSVLCTSAGQAYTSGQVPLTSRDAQATEADCVQGPGATVVTAFSRDQAHKIYVTDKIRQHGDLVWTLLDPSKGTKAVVFISGSAKRMPADVRQALREVVRLHGAMSDDAAGAFLQRMEKEGRYIVEAWSS